MLYIVDGTGEYSDKEYSESMKNSFCKALESQYKGIYLRGPALDGISTETRAKEVYKTIIRDWNGADMVVEYLRAKEGRQVKKFEIFPIYLAGHSRGGAAVIYTAYKLHSDGIPVAAMFLYDAVDRSPITDFNLEYIPPNVKKCYHARRNVMLQYKYLKKAEEERAGSANVEARVDKVRKGTASAKGHIRSKNKAEDAASYARWVNASNADRNTLVAEQIKYQVKDNQMATYMRGERFLVDFENCGFKRYPKVEYEECYFDGTHGAIGGAPKLNSKGKYLIEEDNAAVPAVRSWMESRIRKCGMSKVQGA